MKAVFVLLFLTIVLLTTLSGPTVAAAAGETASVDDVWQVAVRGEFAVIERRVVIDESLSTFVRGSAALQPGALEAGLLAEGAAEASCRLDDGGRLTGGRLTVTCHYTLPVVDQAVTLPEAGMLRFLADIPVEGALGLQIETAGRLTVPGIVAAIPPDRSETLAPGGHLLRRYALSSLSTLVVQGETRLPPGYLGAPGGFGPVTIPFLPRYAPRPAAWIAMLLALALALIAVSRLLPTRARLPLEPRMWQPDLSRVPWYLRPFLLLLVWLVNWLKVNWPRLLNTTVGLTLLVIGLQLLVIAWNIAQFSEEAGELVTPLQALLQGLPVTVPLELLAWPGWPYLVASIGVLLVGVGIGMLARRRLPRLLLIGALQALLAAVVLAWPRLLLAPSLFIGQLELALILGASALFGAALLAAAFSHPQFRNYYDPPEAQR